MPNCRQCQKEFIITDKDNNFYQKIEVPAPTRCPDCRMQRRYAFRNERTLYEDQCDLCGRKMISMYSKSSPYQVYCQECWPSDKWNPLIYGQDYDFSRSFIEQFKELQLKVPRRSLMTMNSVNCDYINMSADCKDCYLIFASENDQNCFYGKLVQHCSDCVDCNFIYDSELCYECQTAYNCFHCLYCQEVNDCRDCYFSANLRGCHDCFLCTNLIHQNYCFLNQQYSEAEYRKKLAEFEWSYQDIQAKLKELEKLKSQRIVKYSTQLRCDDCTGDYLTAGKRVRHSFDITNGQDSAYLTDALDPRDCYDSSFIYYNPQLCYETLSTLNLYNTHFSVYCYSSSDLQYCDLVYSSKNCFACVGFNREGEYCILNKKYSEKDYKKLRDKIIEKLKSEGVWGEFFPYELSCHPYNDTLVQDYSPLSKNEALNLGAAWTDEASKKYEGPDAILARNLPSKISDVTDDILDQVIVCERSGRGFRIIKQELVFYKKMGLPLPHLHPEERHRERIRQRNPRKLWHRQCQCEQPDHVHVGRCKIEFETTYAPDRPEKVYCEECYLKEIY